MPTLDEQGIKGYEVNTWFGFIAPADMLQGHQEAIWADRDQKLEAAREARRLKRAA